LALGALLFCGSDLEMMGANVSHIRLNQAGYIQNEGKMAILMVAGGTQTGSFKVINTADASVAFTASIPATSLGSWSVSYTNEYLLDFSAVTNCGVYYIMAGAVLSQDFPITNAEAIYAPLLTNALFFFQSQRDGPNVLTNVLNRQPSHHYDTNAATYLPPTYNNNDVLVGGLTNTGGPNIDASGGWFDAGDYCKFVETTSYVEGMMWFALRDYPNRLSANGDFMGEVLFGLDWLMRMWDQTNQILYYQVSIGDGNSKINGDHDYWRLPQADDVSLATNNRGYYATSHRPVFRAGPAGSQISPNLAGRLAAAFALASQALRQTNAALANQCLVDAQTIFSLAQTNMGASPLLTASAFDYYPEVSWRDDMEWGAAELYFATAQTNFAGLMETNAMYYLQASAIWASNYFVVESGYDTLNLYDTSAVAEYELYRAISQAGDPGGLAVTQEQLPGDMAAQLASGNAEATNEPFEFSQKNTEYVSPTPHALGLAITANLYETLTGTNMYEAFGLGQRDWVLGKNAWGTTFIVGAGTTFPDCMQDQIGNLGCNLNGVPPIRLGATVAGPADSTSGSGTQSGMIACNDSSVFTNFNSGKAEYYDGVAYWMNVEPAQDYTAPTILLFAQQMGELAAPAPTLAPAYSTNASFVFNLTGAAGFNYILQVTTNLGASNWTSLGTYTAPYSFTDTVAGSYSSRFYRAVSLP
jgi:endoglucanase